MSQQLELLTITGSSQWCNIILIAPEIQKKEVKPFLVLAVKELEGNPDSRTSSIVNVEKFSAIREVVRHFARLRSATKEQWNNEDTRIFLEGLKFNPECVIELASLLCRDEIYINIPKHLQTKPGLVSLHWKIDLSLSQASEESKSSKELIHKNPFIILIFNLTDGTKRTFRVTISKFHELRYNVANILKNMIILEKRKCMVRD